MIAVLAGWLAAVLAAALSLLAWRAYSTRMEVVKRACHEIRGPLTAVRLGLETCSRGGVVSADRFRAIDLEIGKVTLAVDDLACGRRSRSEATRTSATRIDLARLAADSVEAWRGVGEQSGTELTISDDREPVWIVGQRFRVAQAIGNLIANAIEHGGDHVRIRAWSDHATARVEVADDGPGLPMTLTRLVQCNDRARRRAGRGRGLAIAAAIAQAHGGRLSAAPTGRGSYLTLELPTAAAATIGAHVRPHLTVV